MTTSDDEGLGRNAAVMAAGTATSRVLGMVRAALLVAVVGVSTLPANAFAVAYWLPSALYLLIAGGVLNAVLVPQVVRAYRSADGQQYVDRLLTLSGVILLGLTTILTLAVPVVLWIYGARGDTLTLATMFGLWCMPQIFFYGVYALLGQVLNARGNFGPYMWAPVLNNVIAIAGLIGFIAAFGRHDSGPGTELAAWDGLRVGVLAGSSTLGVVAQAVILLVPLYRNGFRYRPRRDWRGAGLGTAGRVAGWTFAALAVGQVAILGVQWVALRAADLATRTDAIDIPGNNAYGLAFTFFMLPHSLVTVSLLTALFTRLSDHAAARDVAAVRSDFSAGLRTIAVFTLFAAPALSVLALPIVRVIFPTAKPAEAASLTPILVAFMAGLVALGAWSLCQRVFYAYEDAKGLFRIQVIMAGVVVAGAFFGYLVLEPRWWVASAAAAISMSYVVGAVWGGAQVWHRLGGGLSRIIRLHVRAGLAAGAAATLGWLVGRVFGDLADAHLLKALVACIVVGSVMLGVYLFLLRRMEVSELDDLLMPLLSRLRRTMGSPDLVTMQGPTPDGGPVRQGAFASTVAEHGGGHLNSAIGRGTLLAGRYRLHQPMESDLPGVECWTARDQILDRPVRALVLRSGNVAAAQDAARRAALVTDPRLLRVLDVGDHEGVPYAVTEPVVGKDLNQLTARGPLPADQARAIIGEAATALEVARRRGVHHLALRPSAVHVSPDGSVVVSGLAMDGEAIGLGPGDAKTTSRADTVGLVALLYLALTGRWPDVPSLGPAEGAVVAPAIAGIPVPPAELSPAVPNDLDTLCVVTLGPHDDGPHSPGELVRDLEPWEPVDAPSIYDSLGGVSRPVTVPSGPWLVSGPIAGVPAAIESPGSVQRQSVHRTFDDQLAGHARPGTPPPAVPPVYRRPATAASSSAHPGPRAVIGSPPAATPPAAASPPASMVPPVPSAPRGARVPHVPPTVQPTRPPGAGRRPPVDEFDAFIGRSSGESDQNSVNATPIVLTLVAFVVVIGLVFAWKSLTAPAPPIGGSEGLDLGSDPTDAPLVEDPLVEDPTIEDPATQDPQTQAPVTTDPPVIASAQMLDPPPGGDNNEHPEAVPQAIDGDPTTFWFSRTYTSPTYGMKPGIGYAVTLAEPATVTAVTLLVNGSGGMVEVRATDPGTPTQGEVLASGALSPQTTLTLSTPTEARHIVLWFTALPQNPAGANRIELLEVQVS